MTQLVRKAKKFARAHKKALWWSAGIGGGALLVYALWPKSAGATAFGIRAPRQITGASPPQFLDQQLAALQTILAAAQAQGNASYAASTQARIADVQKKIAYLSVDPGLTASLNALNWLLQTNYAAMTNGNVVIMSADVFRKIFTHQGTKALDLVTSMFYPHGMCATFGAGQCELFSPNEIANHAHCQTFAGEIVGLGNDWMSPFYTQVYRYPSQNPNYAGNPIDPHADPSAFENARQQSVEAAIQKAMAAADFGDAQDHFNKVLYVTGAPTIGSMYTMVVSDLTRNRLAQLARDMMGTRKIAGADPLHPQTVTNPSFPATDAQGNPIPEPQLTMLHASIGAGIVAHLIDTFESSDAKVNPCIRELTPDLVFQMFAATLGVVIGLAIGPALSGTAVALQMATTIQKLANLSK